MLSFHFSSFVRHHCPTQILLTQILLTQILLTQILQNLGDANRKSNYATLLFCDNLLLAEFFFFFFFFVGGEKQEQASYLASCFRVVGLINCNIRDEIYLSNI